VALADEEDHMAAAREVVVVGAARTPIGAFLGQLSALPAPALGAVAIREAIRRAGADPAAIDEVIMGNVLQAGARQAPARQAALLAGVAPRTPCWTLNEVCGSGLKAIMVGAQAIAAGEADVVVAGGMESMSNVPYYATKARTGARMGNVELVDGLLQDGLVDAYDAVHMGVCAEETALRFGLSRGAQDEYARLSTDRAIDAQRKGLFRPEIAAVEVAGRRGEKLVVAEDEGPTLAKPDRIPSLRPAFDAHGTVTAGNASSLGDGAAALVLMSGARAAEERRAVLARLTHWGSAARSPREFTIAPADAVRRMLERARLSVKDVELWELNEAFAVVALANMQLLGLDAGIVNVRGGAVVLGHPLGATGARIVVTLLQTMRDLGRRRAVASLCIGGGEAVAAMLEVP
jgi:acetyl-CoA C-acetyltransferase